MCASILERPEITQIKVLSSDDCVCRGSKVMKDF